MTVRSLSALVLAAGLCLTNSTRAKEPVRPKAPQPAPSAQPPAAQAGNQQLADSVAARLRASGVASGADVRISTQKGVIQLSGHARTAQQRDEIVRTALGVKGVVSVQHSMELLSGVEAAQALTQTAEPAPLTLPPNVPNMPPGFGGPMAFGGAPAGPMAYGAAPAGPTTDPVPLAPPATPAYDPHGPQMPPYSWPTYAPYNNVSRVAYPEAHPYNAWPYIGPYYPFPKVPLGWRSVQLTWEDGHWYYHRVATPHDYWRVRFW